MISVNRKSLNIVDIFIRIFLLAIAFCFVMSANTLYCNVGDRSMRIKIEEVCLACSVVAVLLLWLKSRVTRTFIQRWVLYAVYVAATYSTIVCLTKVAGGWEPLLAVAFLAITPMLCRLLIDTNNTGFLIDAFVAIVACLAASALILWVLGPLSGMIPSNCVIQSSWGNNGVFANRPGWYGLDYVTQYALVFGQKIVRNTGIFCEAPMFSFVLTVAMLFERYLRPNTRVSILVLLAITIVTTISTTGIIVVLLMVAEMLFTFGDRFGPKAQVALRLLMVLVIAAIALLALSLFNQKMETNSGSTRVDDFAAGFKAWSNNILIGNGFNSDSIQSFMSSFRGNNLGFSNSLMWVLAEGGLLWFAAFLLGVVGFFRLEKKAAYGMLCFLFVWTVTNVPHLPLTVFCFGIGLCALFSLEEHPMQSTDLISRRRLKRESRVTLANADRGRRGA